MADIEPATVARCTRCGDDLSHLTTKVFRCRRYRMGHDPHHWVGKATDVLFYCDGIHARPTTLSTR